MLLCCSRDYSIDESGYACIQELHLQSNAAFSKGQTERHVPQIDVFPGGGVL